MIKELEIAMWEAAKNRDREAFLNLVNKDAIMVCGGYRCTGEEYANIIAEFDCKQYYIDQFEVVCETEDVRQVHYMITTEVNDEQNVDLVGVFHITSTWKKENHQWKLVFNMDHRM